MTDSVTGKVWFVGAGPGAKDLLTLRASQLLANADVVLFDALGTEEALDFCPRARLIPVGKRADGISTEQAFINRRLVTEAQAGYRVVRLKGGDPTVFGRLDEETTALRQADIDFDIVPGITAASAAAAAAKVSLTQRGIARSLVITTPAVQRGSKSDDAWLANCDPTATCAVYMAGKKLRSTAQALMDRGFDPYTPVLLGYAVSTARQRLQRLTIGDLALRTSLADQRFTSTGPCLLIVGRALGQSFDESDAAHETIASRIGIASVNAGATVN